MTELPKPPEVNPGKRGPDSALLAASGLKKAGPLLLGASVPERASCATRACFLFAGPPTGQHYRLLLILHQAVFAPLAY